jgi:hypothetical protein
LGNERSERRIEMKTRRRKLKSIKKGMVLPLVISIAVILAILGMGLIQLGFSGRLRAILTTADISARGAADAGLTEALHRMNLALPFGGPFNDSWLPFTSDDASLTYSNARYNYDITESPTPHAATGRRFWYINSRGRSGRGFFNDTATTEIYTAWFGIGVQDTVNIHSSPDNEVTFISYPPGSAIEGRIRTNSIADNAVWVGPNNEIDGEILVGPGAGSDAVHLGPNTSVTSIGEAADMLSFPPVPVPAGWAPAVLDDSQYDAAGTATILPGSYEYGTFIVDVNETLLPDGTTQSQPRTVSIEGGLVRIYVSGWTRIHNTCQLIIQDGAMLELYLGDHLRAHNGSLITVVNPLGLGREIALQIYGTPTCGEISLHNSGEMWGVIYAPNAALDVDNSATYYGSFIGGSIVMRNNAEFHYDTRLWDLQDEGPAYFAIERWWETAE